VADIWFSILTVFEVTDRPVSSSLCRKAEQQSIAVLHSTLFSRRCHLSTISVQILYLQSLPLCTSSNRPLQYNLYNQYNNTQLLKFSLCCNCTSICAMASFNELYRNASYVLTTFHHSSPNSIQALTHVGNSVIT